MRFALRSGADRRHLRTAVLRDGFWTVIAGVVVGLFATVALGPAIASVLIAVEPRQSPLSLGAATAVATSVGAMACWWSARRASDADPASVLRSE